MSDTFFFAAFIDGRTAITVIDLDYGMSYERDDWAACDDNDFTDRDSAISHARSLARCYGKRYELFESRYDESTNEVEDW